MNEDEYEQAVLRMRITLDSGIRIPLDEVLNELEQ